jgi:hypothetical protein
MQHFMRIILSGSLEKALVIGGSGSRPVVVVCRSAAVVVLMGALIESVEAESTGCLLSIETETV